MYRPTFGQTYFNLLWHSRMFAMTKTTTASASSENVTFRFSDLFSLILSHLAYDLCTNYPGIKVVWEVFRQGLKSSAQLHNRLLLTEQERKPGCEICKNENASRKACKPAVSLLNMQICDIPDAVEVASKVPSDEVTNFGSVKCHCQ